MSQTPLDADQTGLPFPPELFMHYNGTLFGYDCRPIHKAMMRLNEHWTAALDDGREEQLPGMLDDELNILTAIDYVAEHQT